MPQETSPDARGLDQLAKSGSDLSKLHSIDFTLRFPTQTAAQKAELNLIGLAFDTKLEHGKSASEWIIIATKVMYPSQTDLEGLRDKLDQVAADNHGTYVGWKAKLFVRKPEG